MASKPLDAEEFAQALLPLISKVMLDRWLWRAFGFRGHPRRRRIWEHFVAAERLADERFLLREFAVVAFDRVIRSTANLELGIARLPVLARVYELLVMGVRPDEPFWPALSFASADHCARYFAVGLEKYQHSEYASFTSTFLVRAPTQPNSVKLGKWAVGAAAIFSTSTSPLPWIATSVGEIAQGRAIIGTPQLAQDAFMHLLRGAIGSHVDSEEE